MEDDTVKTRRSLQTGGGGGGERAGVNGKRRKNFLPRKEEEEGSREKGEKGILFSKLLFPRRRRKGTTEMKMEDG